MKLRCPLNTRYISNGTVALLTQLFGENKNRLFYGNEGHKGVDFRTQGKYKWVYKYNKLVKQKRDLLEEQGYIPLVACHEGYLTTNFYYRAKSMGWAMFINWKENHTEWRALYYHIETPWRSLGMAFKALKWRFKPEIVRKGAVVAIAGNSGFPRYSTGAHLHFELQKKVDGKWVSVDPTPYFNFKYKRI